MASQVAGAAAVAVAAAGSTSPPSLLLTAKTRVATGVAMNRHATNSLPTRGRKAEVQQTQHCPAAP